MPPKKRRSIASDGAAAVAPGRKPETKAGTATTLAVKGAARANGSTKTADTHAPKGATRAKASSRVSDQEPSRRAKPRPAGERSNTGTSARRRAGSGTIEDAIELAVKCHRGQTDKYDLPYILHVFGVAARCRTIEEKIVAFLHDTVEDGHTTFEELRRLGFTKRVIEAVEKITRRKGESYESFVERIAPNALARAVKLADLEDNMDVRRSDRAMKVKDAERMEKYRKAWQKLAALVVAEES